MIPIVIDKYPREHGKRTGRLWNQRTSSDHPDYSIFKIGQNIESSPRDLRRLAVTQTSMKDHQLTVVVPFLKWTRDQLKQITKNLMTMHKALHPRDDVDGLYVSRKEGGRGFAIIEDSVDISIQRLKDYIEKYERRLITAIRNNTNKTIDNRMTITRKQKWVGKQLYRRLKRLINNISYNKTWTWLSKGDFKRETELLLMAIQNRAIGTNHIKARIDKMQQNSKCRLCGDRDEIINHRISKCSKLAQKEYKARHDWVGKVIHWEMLKKFKYDHTNQWYMHNPAPGLIKDSHKLPWDFDIETVHLICARRPDLIIINKNK